MLYLDSLGIIIKCKSLKTTNQSEQKRSFLRIYRQRNRIKDFKRLSDLTSNIRDRVFHLSLSQTRAQLVRGWILLAAKISHQSIVAKFIPDYEANDQKLATPATSIQCDKILLSMVHAAICNTFISIDLFLIIFIINSLSTKLCVFTKSFGRDSEKQQSIERITRKPDIFCTILAALPCYCVAPFSIIVVVNETEQKQIYLATAGCVQILDTFPQVSEVSEEI